MLNDGPQNGQHSTHDSRQGGHGSDFFGEIVWRNHFALGYQGRDPWEKVDQPTK